MNRSRIFSLIALAAISVFVVSCSEDDNPANVPTLGTISGRVTFAGNWPATGSVQVSIWADGTWPPMGPPEGFSAVIPSGLGTYDFTIDGLKKLNYEAISVGWRHPTNPAGARVLGTYINDISKSGVAVTSGQPVYDPAPIAIIINDAKMIWTGLDIRADLSLAQ